MIHDNIEDKAMTSVIGPSTHLEYVLFTVRKLAQGASSILNLLPHLACDALSP